MHIGFIMDGNRRWAKEKGFPKFFGHKKGVDNLEKVIKFLPEFGIKQATFYALSTENMRRSEEELSNLFTLLGKFCEKTDIFEKNKIKCKFIGKKEGIPEKVLDKMTNLENLSKDFDGLFIEIGINYGGRDEIIRACKKISEKKEKFSEENILKNLDSISEPEIIIRTGGKKRTSNFLLWQSAYSEFFFLDKFWPDFGKKELEEVLKIYKNEDRNFGK